VGVAGGSATLFLSKHKIMGIDYQLVSKYRKINSLSLQNNFANVKGILYLSITITNNN
jgi:acetylglutamate kinase